MPTAELYFSATDASNNRSLWVTDGTAQGTRQLSTPATGLLGIAPSSFAVLGNQVFFRGDESRYTYNQLVTAYGLFAIDSTTNAVSTVANTGTSASLVVTRDYNPTGITAYNGRLYFSGTTLGGVIQLMSSDGTSAGTSVIAFPSSQPTVNSLTDAFTPFQGRLAFGGSVLTPSSLYLTDGTTAGTVAVPVPGAGPAGPQILDMASLGNVLVFEAQGASVGSSGLFVSDGTSAGTSQLLIPSLSRQASVTGLLSFGTRAAFVATDTAGAYGIWVTDGTPSGTIELPGLTSPTLHPSFVALPGGRFAFDATNGSQSAIYVSDGTPAGTTQLPLPNGVTAPGAIMVMGGTLLFDATLPTGQRALFASDGTLAGTIVVANGLTLPSQVDGDFALVPGTATNVASGVTTTILALGPNPRDTSTNIAVASNGNAIRLDAGTVTTVPGTSGNIITLGSDTTFVSDGGSDTIFGGTGSGNVFAGPGTTIAVGGAGTMAFTAGAGTSTVFAGTGGLVFTGGAGTTTVVGGGNRVTATAGTGGGALFGGGNAILTGGTGAQTVLVGSNGDQLYSAGNAGDLFGVIGPGNVYMDGTASTGDDVFFGAAGMGTLTFITGSGNDLLGLGQGTNLVTLGSGHSTVFANTGTTATSTITAGAGSADIGLGGAAVTLAISAGTAARTLTLYNFLPGADHVALSGFAPTAAASALANQTYAAGSTTLSLGDGTSITLIGTAHADSRLFS